jgi:hypothetical protein
MTRCSLKYLDELIAIKEKKKKKHKQKQEPQLLVSTSEILAPTDTP